MNDELCLLCFKPLGDSRVVRCRFTPEGEEPKEALLHYDCANPAEIKDQRALAYRVMENFAKLNSAS